MAGRVRQMLTALGRPGWRRAVLLRRVAAGVLAVLAAVLTLRPVGSGSGSAGSVTIVVAAHDLTPGTTLGAADVMLRRLPESVVPAGAEAALSQVDGRVLAGAARAGEPITDVRLAGPELAALASGLADAASVAVRLSDPDVAALLRPGVRVDVVTTGLDRDEASVLATDATVLAVLPTQDRTRVGRLVVVALPRKDATRVAGAALGQGVSFTLR